MNDRIYPQIYNIPFNQIGNIVYGIVVSKRKYKMLERNFKDWENAKEKALLGNALGCVPIDGIRVMIKKYERGIKYFYDSKSLMDYVNG